MSELVKYDRGISTSPMSLDELKETADILAKSGFFRDSTQMAQAFAKIKAGQELGIGPMAAMAAIHIIDGKIVLSVHLMSGLIKRSGKYDYRVKVWTNKEVKIVYYEKGEEIGTSEFTLGDAEMAGLLGKEAWRKYPRNMLFSRAMSNGFRLYCADLTLGPIYTPEEIDMVIDNDAGDSIEAKFSDSEVMESDDSDSNVEDFVQNGTVGREEREKRHELKQAIEEFKNEASRFGFDVSNPKSLKNAYIEIMGNPNERGAGRPTAKDWMEATQRIRNLEICEQSESESEEQLVVSTPCEE